MDKIHKDRFEKIIEFLDNLPPEKFYYGDVVRKMENGCGTICCAVGYFPSIFPEDFCWISSSDGNGSVLRKDNDNFVWQESNEFLGILEGTFSAFLGILEGTFSALFFPGFQYKLGFKNLDKNATPREVANLIRKFLQQ